MLARILGLVLVVALAGCGGPRGGPVAPGPAARAPQQAPTAAEVDRLRDVVARVEPVAERSCRRHMAGGNCDFLILVDDRPGQPPNAFQTVSRGGRPVLAVTTSLVAEVRNADELAFVMGHEAAHHIAGHIPRQMESARTGAILLGGLASLTGAGRDTVEAAVDLGAAVGARRYSKAFELEADALGTVIAHEAGFDPVRGAEFFATLPDPGDRFLGTHPPNAQRIALVRRVAAGL